MALQSFFSLWPSRLTWTGSRMNRVTFGTCNRLCSIRLWKNLGDLTLFRLIRLRSRRRLIALEIVHELVSKLSTQNRDPRNMPSGRASLDVLPVGKSLLFTSLKYACDHQQLEKHSIGQVVRSSWSYISSDQPSSSGIGKSIVNYIQVHSIRPSCTQYVSTERSKSSTLGYRTKFCFNCHSLVTHFEKF